MDLRQIRTFVHIAELKNFTPASGFLHVSQPALSRQMRMLEDELGISLFHRHGHGIQVTSEGAHFLDRCKKILNEFETLKGDFQRSGRTIGATGIVGVGLPVPATRFLSPAFLENFAQEYAGISLRVAEGYSALLHEWLMSGSLDLAVLYGVRENKMLVIERLIVEDLYAIVRPTMANRLKTSITAKELCDSPLVLPNRPHILRDLVDQLQFSDIRVIEVGAITMMLDFAATGRGTTILPRSSAEHLIAAGRVVAIPIHDPSLSWEVSLCHSTLKPLTQAAELVRHLVRSELVRMVREQQWPAKLIQVHNLDAF